MTTISHLQTWKQQKRKFASITAYDAAFSRLFSKEGIEVMLVGDSLGMVIQGYNSTLPVTLEDMVYHTRCVRRGAPSCFLLADLPFMNYSTPIEACKNAAALIRAGANIVKVEGGGTWLVDTIHYLTERAVPVCAHLGLTPQSVNIFGGYKVQGRDPAGAEKLLANAQAVEKSGAELLVLECVPIALAESITQTLTIPVIGIGAGSATDGQILVMHDAFGITNEKAPSFTKDFLAESKNITEAIRRYVKEVESGEFPSMTHSFI
ncbi:3-methyl-2-oxobutanoate hydroxymethyltransferase [secondary endosymbiont of Heteropsylla cubana]|uniref:3-methyl-2-oxobutanoate hydroxymethyltransferase n=1 Tax=secondary endosymbiont of Heteropsylla cubana TaxID=134287 RepID=J3YT69_9ENTR|nr:3-methyl-2-oxobutanoate hydroxymethyltransferase [secondary endosymbiont of Heteropsylla cubana]AFP85623.1 3-methyl-2-oxobutanoate hydroxymethyltransferase [secondary endosymbiont of Heteropsylla cubana]